MTTQTERPRNKKGPCGQPLSKAHGVAPKVLIFDIETSPMLAYVWGFYKQFISPSQVVQPTEMLCYSAKWLGEKTVFFDSQQGEADDKRVCETMIDLFDKADIVVAHNGQGFDEKVLRARWLHHGFVPPRPYKSVDTLKIAKTLRTGCNKLDYLAQYLGVGRKMEHEGFALWTKCLAGDRKAWQRMEAYNIQDVLILEDVYLKMRAWDKRHPNIALYYPDDKERCTVCGSTTMKTLTKKAMTAVSIFASYRCNSCGHIMRDGTREKIYKHVMRNAQ